MKVLFVFLIFFIFIISSLIVIYVIDRKTYKVELVQALFRHGERIPDKGEVYKTDPYDPEFYKNYGQLTQVGKERMFQVGQMLKQRYGSLIGDYNADHVYGYSTDYHRTKESLQMVLAGLFSPPTDKSNWEQILSWTPLPTHSEPFDSCFLFAPILNSRYNFRELFKEVENSPEIRKRIDRQESMLNYVRNKTGLGSFRSFSAVFVASNFGATKSMGLELPSWVTKEVFEMFTEVGTVFLDTITFTPKLRKMTVGPLVNAFLQNMRNHEKGDKRKIYLYSAHDLTMAPFTKTHNFTGLPVFPTFGSTVIVEKLRGSDNEAYVRMFMWRGVGEPLMKLKLGNFDHECPLAEYEKMVAPLLPDFDFDRRLSENLAVSEKTSDKNMINPEFRLAYQFTEDDMTTFKYGDELYINTTDKDNQN